MTLLDPLVQLGKSYGAIFFGNDNGNVMIWLPEAQVSGRVFRTRSRHYSGNVHGSVEIPPLSLALNEAVLFSVSLILPPTRET